MEVAVFDTKKYDREYLTEAAKGSGVNLRFLEARLSVQTAELASGCRAVCLFVNDLADAAVLEILKSKGVEMLALRCAGYNQVDLPSAEKLALRVTRVPEYSPHAVAEHSVALYLCLNRHIHQANNRVREQNFSLNGLMGSDLHGKTVGVIGAGRIGKIAAQLFKGFGTRVLVSDPKKDEVWAKKAKVEYKTLDVLFKQSDIISLHAPLTPKTFHMVDKKAFGLMKPDAYLINTSRGKLVDTSALIQALKKNRLGGVCLDVYEEEAGIFFEDFSDRVMEDDQLSRLLSFPRVLMTSHQAYFTKEAMEEISKTTMANLQLFAAGKKPLKNSALNQF